DEPADVRRRILAEDGRRQTRPAGGCGLHRSSSIASAVLTAHAWLGPTTSRWISSIVAHTSSCPGSGRPATPTTFASANRPHLRKGPRLSDQAYSSASANHCTTATTSP